MRRARSYYTIEFDICRVVCTSCTSWTRWTRGVCARGADVCGNVALTLNIVIPSIHAIFLHLSCVYLIMKNRMNASILDKSCVPCRAAGARAGAVCRRASARLATPAPRVATTTAHTEPPPALSFRFTLGSISRHLGHCRVIGHVGRAGTTPLKKPGQSDVVVSWCGVAVGAATEKETATLCALP